MIYTMDFWRLREKKNKMSILDNSLKLFVSNIPFSITRYKLQSYFQQFGPLNLENTTLRTDRRGQRIGFVAFNSQGCLEIALRSSPHFLDGQFLQVIRMTPNKQANPQDRPREDVVEQVHERTETEVSATEKIEQTTQINSEASIRGRRSSSCKRRSSRKRSRSRSRSFSRESLRTSSRKRCRSNCISLSSSENSSSTSDSRSESESPSHGHQPTEQTAEEVAEYQKELEEELQTIQEQAADVESARQRRRARWRNRK